MISKSKEWISDEEQQEAATWEVDIGVPTHTCASCSQPQSTCGIKRGYGLTGIRLGTFTGGTYNKLRTIVSHLALCSQVTASRSFLPELDRE